MDCDGEQVAVFPVDCDRLQLLNIRFSQRVHNYEELKAHFVNGTEEIVDRIPSISNTAAILVILAFYLVLAIRKTLEDVYRSI